jgi:hypothetical protein
MWWAQVRSTSLPGHNNHCYEIDNTGRKPS